MDNSVTVWKKLLCNPFGGLPYVQKLQVVKGCRPKSELKWEVHCPAADFAAVKEAMDTGSATIVDVRNPGELKEEGKIPKAINVPLPELKEAVALPGEEFQKKYGCARPGERDALILHCKGGIRAAKAAGQLTESGYSNLKVYMGSFGDWVSQGGPVEK